jgi:hypothetical protein
LLQDAGPHAIDYVVTAAVLDDNGIDAIEMKQVTQQQSRGAGANNAHLRPEATHG